MRHPLLLLMITGLGALGGCGQGDTIDVANNDSAGLVQAIRQANARPGHDTIRLARNGLYILANPAEPGLLLPPVQGQLTIEGNHAEIRGYSDKPAAILQLDEASNVRISHLVIAEGNDGAVRNYGRLRMDNVAVVDSSVATMPAIVLNHGRLEASDSQIAYNLLLDNRRDAGTVLNYGELELERTRIHDNRTVGRSRTLAAAGGILNFGTVKADGLQLEDNELAAEDSPRLSFGGILNLGNGKVSGTTPAAAVRDARQAELFAGF